MKIKRIIMILLSSIIFCFTISCKNENSVSESYHNIDPENNATHTADSLTNTETEGSKNHNVVRVLQSYVELAEIAYTLDDLINRSGIIAEVEVTETYSYVPDDIISINTVITPNIIKCYKGEYDGSKLIVCGGYMKLKDYISSKSVSAELNEMQKNAGVTTDFTAEELEQEIYSDWQNNYVPEIGDRLLFFGKKGTDDMYHVTHSYQGLFVMKDNTWQNQALEYMHDNFTEPLVKDIIKKITSTKILDNVKSLFNNHEKIIGIPANKFTDKLIDLIRSNEN